MSDFDRLTRLFEAFPGVGARQAKRFVYHLLHAPADDVAQLVASLHAVRSSVIECTQCRRYFTRQQDGSTICDICRNATRDREKLLVVAQDNDLQAIERSGVYNGLYFVLGGTVPLLSENETKRVRINGLKKLLEQLVSVDGCREVILGFPVNPDGENTARFVRSQIAAIIEPYQVTVAQLGRGLSTGSELEYADSETLKSAWSNRTADNF